MHSPVEPDDFHIIGYALALSGLQCELQLTNQNTTIQAEEDLGSTNFDGPAQRVLAADAIISNFANTPSYAHPDNVYDEVNVGYMPNGQTYPATSPHVKNRMPQGSNVGYKDAHVTWQNFMNAAHPMVLRSNPNPNTLCFWW
jgi:hypothetical protein